MAEIVLSDLKEKFATVQSIGQDLKEQKIRLDSEKVALDSQYREKLAELFEKTGATTYEQAIQVVQDLKAKLDSDTQELYTELSKYLDTYGEDSEGVS